MHPDQEKLNKAGYVTKRFTEYHFQVKKRGGTVKVNVWPTARKILKEFTAGPAPYYTDILAAVKPLLEKPSRKTFEQMKQELRDMYPIIITKEGRYLEWWRAKPMERLQEYVENI